MIFDKIQKEQKKMRKFLKANGYIGMRAIFKNARMKCACYLSQSDDPDFENEERGFMDCLHREEETTQVAMLDNFFFFAERDHCEYLTEVPEDPAISPPIEPEAAEKIDKKQQLRGLIYDAWRLVCIVEEDRHLQILISDLNHCKPNRLRSNAYAVKVTIERLQKAYKKLNEAVRLEWELKYNDISHDDKTEK
jgi:hypothetical protein